MQVITDRKLAEQAFLMPNCGGGGQSRQEQLHGNLSMNCAMNGVPACRKFWRKPA